MRYLHSIPDQVQALAHRMMAADPFAADTLIHRWKAGPRNYNSIREASWHLLHYIQFETELAVSEYLD